MGPRGRKIDPEEMKKMAAMRTTAEAYKNLANLYREQGKTDEAVAQLKKILDLHATVTDPDVKRRVADQIGRVYNEIGEIYLEKGKTAEAEAILNEGVEKTKTENPEIASRMMLQLGNMMRKAGKTAEAEKAFQRVIELNSGALTAPKK
ncbi:MAG TPA: tetratricopeptide repeat protein [Candidatus Ozemobacteraceae bacterium]